MSQHNYFWFLSSCIFIAMGSMNASAQSTHYSAASSGYRGYTNDVTFQNGLYILEGAQKARNDLGFESSKGAIVVGANLDSSADQNFVADIVNDSVNSPFKGMGLGLGISAKLPNSNFNVGVSYAPSKSHIHKLRISYAQHGFEYGVAAIYGHAKSVIDLNNKSIGADLNGKMSGYMGEIYYYPSIARSVISPYLGVAIGYMAHRTTIDLKTSKDGYSSGNYQQKHSRMAYGAGIGILINIANNAQLDARYSLSNFGFKDQDFDLSSSKDNSRTIKVKSKSFHNNFEMILRIKF